MAVDMFCDPSAAVQAASAEDKTATTATTSEDDAHGRAAKRSVFEIIMAGSKFPWRIPEAVERGLEIPICFTGAHSIPECGSFPRLGMDVVVNAVWLAYYWAKVQGDPEAVSALESLILDWPMDFVLIEGSTPEEVEQKICGV